MIDNNATVVIFTKTNARVIVNPPELAALIKHKLAILKPDLTHVKGVPPHFWKYEYGMIVPMNAEEQDERLKLIQQNGVDNNLVITPQIVTNDLGKDLREAYDNMAAEVSAVNLKNKELVDARDKVLHEVAVAKSEIDKERAASLQLNNSLEVMRTNLKTSLDSREQDLTEMHKVIRGLEVEAEKLFTKLFKFKVATLVLTVVSVYLALKR